MKASQPGRELPLAGQANASDQLVAEREAELARLVHHFYTVARADALLGPVFESRVSDWDKHLAAMKNFWSAAIYRTGRYRGRPLEAHRRIDQLSPAHFSRWLVLWEQSVAQTVSSDAREPLVAMARRMSDKMLRGRPARHGARRRRGMISPRIGFLPIQTPSSEPEQPEHDSLHNRPATSLPLLREIRRCRVCEDDLPSGPRPLLAASALSRVVIIGQAPGRMAHETGVPWNDKSGRRLRDWLGVTDAQFYDESLFALVPMGFCYPGRGRSGDNPPRRECARLWHPRILPKLLRTELTVYVGVYSFERSPPRLASEVQDFTEAVRAAHRLLPARIVLPHPSPRNQMWIKRNPWFEQEVVPALRQRVRGVVRSVQV